MHDEVTEVGQARAQQRHFLVELICFRKPGRLHRRDIRRLVVIIGMVMMMVMVTVMVVLMMLMVMMVDDGGECMFTAWV